LRVVRYEELPEPPSTAGGGSGFGGLGGLGFRRTHSDPATGTLAFVQATPDYILEESLESQVGGPCSRALARSRCARRGAFEEEDEI